MELTVSPLFTDAQSTIEGRYLKHQNRNFYT